MKQEKSRKVIQHYTTVRNITNGEGYNDYFDGMSGMSMDQHHIISGNFTVVPNKEAIYVFDWDRTITMVEGFLSQGHNPNPWHEYHTFLKQYYPKLDSNPENHLKMMCGGSERYNSIKRFIAGANINNVYVLTNNPLIDMIRYMASLLGIMPQNVQSMHCRENRRFRNKTEWIKQNLL